MKAEDFKISYCPSGKTNYLHIQNGKKREQILNAMQNGTMTSEEFKSEQKKMRGGNYLNTEKKCILMKTLKLK